MKYIRISTVDVVSTLVEKGGKILLVKRSDKAKYFPGMLAFPGGKREEGENIFDAAIREIGEETGYKVVPMHKKKYFLGEVVRDNVRAMFYLIRCKIVGEGIKVEDDMVDEFLWGSPQVLIKSLEENDFYKDQIQRTKEALRSEGVHQ